MTLQSGQLIARHETFMALALEEAEQALADNEFPVGCVLVHEGRVVGRGRRRNSSGSYPNELEHAEITAIQDLYRIHPNLDHGRITAYSTMEPCLMCFSALLLNNIHTIVYGYEDAMGGAADLPLQRLTPLYRNMKVTIIPHVLRKACLALFLRFFNDSRNKYWRGSYLAEYTLDQRIR